MVFKMCVRDFENLCERKEKERLNNTIVFAMPNVCTLLYKIKVKKITIYSMLNVFFLFYSF